MDKEQRIKLLKGLARSSEGMALKEHFQELIRELTNGKNFKSDDFEMDGKASIKASIVLEKVIRDLNSLGKDKDKRKINNYI